MNKNLSRFVAALLATSTTLVNIAPAYAAQADPGPKPKIRLT